MKKPIYIKLHKEKITHSKLLIGDGAVVIDLSGDKIVGIEVLDYQELRVDGVDI